MALVYVQKIFDTTLSQYVRYETLVPTASPAPSTTVPPSSGNYSSSSHIITASYDDPSQGGGGGGGDPELESRVANIEGQRSVHVTKDDFVYVVDLDAGNAWIYYVPADSNCIYYDLSGIPDLLAINTGIVAFKLPAGSGMVGKEIWFHQDGASGAIPLVPDTSNAYEVYIIGKGMLPNDVSDAMEGSLGFTPAMYFPQSRHPDDITRFALLYEQSMWRMPHWSSAYTYNRLTSGGASQTLSGDVIGSVTSNLITKLQGNTLSATFPNTGNVITYNGTSWVAGPATVTLSGDVTGANGSTTVAYIQNRPVSGTTPTESQVLTYSSGTWIPSDIPSQNARRTAQTYVVGNSSAAYGDNATNCDYLDTGNGVQLQAACNTPYTTVIVRPGVYTLSSPLTIATGTTVIGLRGNLPYNSLHGSPTQFSLPGSGNRKAVILNNNASLIDVGILLPIPGAGASGPEIIEASGPTSYMERVSVRMDATTSATETLTAMYRMTSGSPVNHFLVDCSFVGRPQWAANGYNLAAIDNATGLHIDRCYIANCDRGIVTTQTGAVTRVSNSYVDCLRQNISVSGSQAFMVSVTNNQLLVRPDGSSPLLTSAISIASANTTQHINVTGNHITSMLATGSGIDITPSASTLSNAVVTGNRITGFVTGVVFGAGTTGCVGLFNNISATASYSDSGTSNIVDTNRLLKLAPVNGTYLSTLQTVSGAAATVSAGTDLVEVTYSGGVCVVTLPTLANAPIGTVIQISKANTGAFKITVTPDTGSSINGGTVNTPVDIPNSATASSATTNDVTAKFRRTGSSTWRMA